jgi:hypothetical protein
LILQLQNQFLTTKHPSRTILFCSGTLPHMHTLSSSSSLKSVKWFHFSRYVQLAPSVDIALVEADVGESLGPYFPHDTWLLCSDRHRAASIARHPGVVWVGIRPPSHRISRGLDVVMEVSACIILSSHFLGILAFKYTRTCMRMPSNRSEHASNLSSSSSCASLCVAPLLAIRTEGRQRARADICVHA